MSDMPRFILRNCPIFDDRTSLIGQASEITLPVPSVKLEEVRNAGMLMPIEIDMGYEKSESAFKMTGFDPQVISLFSLGAGVGALRQDVSSGWDCKTPPPGGQLPR